MKANSPYMKNVILVVLFFSCSACVNLKKSTNHMKNTVDDKLIVYQLFTRYFGNQNLTNKFNGTLAENGSGKFDDITDEALTELKKFGSSHIWYTGVIEHATMTDFTECGIPKDNSLVIKGIAGSPYAIKDYYDVNPALANDINNRMAEFEKLIERTHKAGLKVVIDFVPNHVSRAYKSDAKPNGTVDFGEDDDMTVGYKTNNNFYYLPGQKFQSPEGVSPAVKPDGPFIENPAKATGNDVFSPKPSINDWYETIKLNYGVDYQNHRETHFDPIPDTWLKMYDILHFWQQKGVDGFRCDMAEMVPVEFWGWVIPKLKVNGPITFIAEIYNPKEYGNYVTNGKFDYLYDKVGLYDALRRLMEGGGSTEDISKVWQEESGEISNHMLRFLENHDEQRIASRFFANDAKIGKTAMALSGTLHGGPLMYYYGQEVGVKPTEAEGFQGEDGRTTIFDYWGVPEFQNWVNGGKFDGGKLTVDQKSLRDFYVRLNKFILENEAIRTGKFWDLQYVNINGQSENYDKHHTYSFIRYTKNQRLLFVYNFDLEDAADITLKFPKEVVDKLTVKGNSVKLNEVFTGNQELKISASELTKSNDPQSGLKISLQPDSFKVFEF